MASRSVEALHWPNLPTSWRAPTCLVRDLGISAGRLYFDFDEQSHAVYKAFARRPPASTIEYLSIELTEMDLWHELRLGDTQRDTKGGCAEDSGIIS